MTVLMPTIYERDYTAQRALPFGVKVQATRFSHAAMGGPKSAELRVTGPLASLWSCLGWLRSPVEIYNERAELLWWGFVQSCEVGTGAVTVGASLDEMANKVRVAYEEAGQNYGEAGMRATTTAATDATSIAAFGTKDLLYSMSSSTADLAEAQRDRLLAALKDPIASMDIGAGDVGATLQCVGWWDLLDWQHYSTVSVGVLYVDVWPNYYHAIRTESNWYRLGQSFTVPAGLGTIYADWVDACIFQQGDSGSQNITFTIRANGTGGVPGAVLSTATAIPASSVPNDWGYRKASFGTKCALTASTTYHLVMEVDQPGSSTDYIAWRGTWGDAGYTGGVAYGQASGGGAITGDGADFLFAVNCARETTDQVSAMVTALANSMIQGTVIKTASGIYTPPYRAGDVRGLREIEQLLDAGTSTGSRLLATVRRDRYVEVYAEPAASATSDVYVRTDGRLVSWRGQPIDKASLTPGQWLRLILDDRAESELGLLGNVSPCFIDETEYTAASDSVSLRTREKTSIWDIGKVVML
jgi:hypothetical protein